MSQPLERNRESYTLLWCWGSAKSRRLTKELCSVSRRIRSIAVLFFAMAPFAALAEMPPLDVKVVASTVPSEKEAGIVTVTVTNRSERPLLILMVDSALLTDGDHLLNNVMTVSTVDGQVAAYQGRASRPLVGDRASYRAVVPGESMSSRVNLPANYDMEGGQYSVSYTQRYLEEGELSPDGAVPHKVESNVLTIYVNANLIQGYKILRSSVERQVSRAPGPDNTCQNTQEHPEQVTINNARSTASSWSFFGYSDAGSLFKTTYGADATGKIVWRAKIDNDVNYTTWFGAPQDTSPTFPSPPKVEDVWDAGDFLPLHVTKAIWARVNNTDSYSCGCSADYESLHTVAWTEPTVTHLCSLFWTLPFSTYGADNQVLTILHENAHHADAYGPYVGDYNGGYGRGPAKNLAITDRSKAIMNADNYAYYVEAARMKRDALVNGLSMMLDVVPDPVLVRSSLGEAPHN